MACNYYNLTISAIDTANATGNSNPANDGVVFVEYYDCSGTFITGNTYPSGFYTNAVTSDTDFGGFSFFYLQSDIPNPATSSFETSAGPFPPVTPSPTETPTLTPTETPTNTPNSTPTITPTVSPTTSCACEYYDVDVTNNDILSATGNTGVNAFRNGVVFVTYRPCSGGTVTIQYTVANYYSNAFCHDNTYGITIDVWQDDSQIAYSSSAIPTGVCCTDTTPTPTPTETPTPTLTSTITETPTITPTNTSTLTQTQTPTLTSTETPTNTPTSTLGETPTPTPTPTNTLTPTNTPTETPTNTPTNTLTPTVTPTLTPTNTPTLTNTSTPTQTPTNTQTSTQTPTLTQTVTNTVTPTSSMIPGVVVQFQDCENGSNIFRFGGSIGSLTLGTVYYITGSGDFTGCATVVTQNGSGPLYTANGVTFTSTVGCADPVCPRTPKVAAVLSKCSNGSLFYATVDEDVAFPGATYIYNNECYSFIEFSGPGGPDLGEPDFDSCIKCVLTPTPTPTSLTPTPTPTVSSTPLNCYCPDTTFCLDTNWIGLTGYSGTYVKNSGYYNCCPFYEGGGFNYGVIYNTGQYWCLSDSLGGTCLLTGSQTCFSNCPDLDANIFTVGACPAPPTPGPDCTILDFNAYFDCNYTVLPTPIPCYDIDLVLTAMTTTPTPTPSGQFCNGVGISFSLSSYTPSSNVTPTPTPTVTPTVPISISGNATFEVFQEQFVCASVKVLVDCASATEYYVSDSLSYNGTPITTGMTIFVSIDGVSMCVTYDRDDSKISSNASINQIYNISGGGCLGCQMTPSPTPTLTKTPAITMTPTLTQTPSYTPSTTPTSTVTSTTGFIPSQTPTNTPTVTIQPTSTQTPTFTPTMTSTPTSSPTYVYVYQSCVPQQLIPYLENQVIQTIQVPGVTEIGATFKDVAGNCWRYVGYFPSNYIPPINVVSTTYQGNYFLGRQETLYSDCNTCINGTPGTGEYVKVSQQGSMAGLPDGCGGYGAVEGYLSIEIVDSTGQPVIAASDITVVVELSYSDCLGTSSPTETINITILKGESSKITSYKQVDYEPCPYDLRCTPVTRGFNGISQIYPSTVNEYVP